MLQIKYKTIWKLSLKHTHKPDMVVHFCNPSTQKAEAGG
jgi:hypothetical protein